MANRLKKETILGMRGQTLLLLNITKEFKLQNIETIRRWLRTNKPNGPLTSKAALAIISQALNVPEINLIEEFIYEIDTKRNYCNVPSQSGQNSQRNRLS
jgi:hypothetical protein